MKEVIVLVPPELTADASKGTMQRVATTLRATLQCWRCDTGDEVVIQSGELEGPLGRLPLFTCVPCAKVLERLYYMTFGQQAPEEAAPEP